MARNGRNKGHTQLLLGLAAGLTIKEAAARAGIGERTAYRYLSDPAFRSNLRQLQHKVVDQAVQRLAGIANIAVDRLRKLLDSDDERVQLAAARYLAEFARKTWEAEREDMQRSVTPDEARSYYETLAEAVRRAVPDEEVQVRIGVELEKALVQQEAFLTRLEFSSPRA